MTDNSTGGSYRYAFEEVPIDEEVTIPKDAIGVRVESFVFERRDFYIAEWLEPVNENTDREQ